ncbi:MAG: tetratricopeptide repeat protein [Candidatus Neomarinimicrobiota bacterium]
MALSPIPGWGQSGSWEQLTEDGNRALAGGTPLTAEVRFREALTLSKQFAPEDLRRATARRNLAQTLVLLGRFGAADSLYRQAIAAAGITLVEDHAYILGLREELASLREAMALSDREDTSRKRSLSLRERIRELARWLATASVADLGATLPLGGALAGTHDGGLHYGLKLQQPLFSLGSLPVGLGLGYTTTAVPGIHATADHYRISGTALDLSSTLGRLSLSLGLGVYNVAGGPTNETRLGFAGELAWALLRDRDLGESLGLDLALLVRDVAIPGPELINLVQLGIRLGLRPR